MKEEKEKIVFIVPPRLKEPVIYLGFTFFEAFMIICGIVVGFFFKITLVLVITGFSTGLICRFNGESNLLKQLTKKIKYYRKSQIYLERLCVNDRFKEST